LRWWWIRGGPKIKEVEADPDSAPVDPKVASHAPKSDDGFPILAHGSTSLTIVNRGRYRTKYYRRSMAEFTKSLVYFIVKEKGMNQLSNSPRVLDKTGLTGKYTFVLEFRNPDFPPVAPLAAAPGSSLGVSDPADADDVFTAVRKQLGLRIDKTADVPLDVIIVESVDKTPTEN
jgi:uncharacterized protein (TIGR03435 family)